MVSSEKYSPHNIQALSRDRLPWSDGDTMLRLSKILLESLSNMDECGPDTAVVLGAFAWITNSAANLWGKVASSRVVEQ